MSKQNGFLGGFFTTKLLMVMLASLALTGCEAVNSIDQSFKKLTGSKQAQETSSGQTETASGLAAMTNANCPHVKIVDELSTVSRYVNPVMPQDKDFISNAKFSALKTGCTAAPTSVTVEIAADFDGKLGPAAHDVAPQEHFTYPYFVTVITPQGEILSKDIFAMTMIYQDAQTPLKKTEHLRQTIPLSAGQKASDYQILLGFQLDPNELSYNRAHPVIGSK